ncbi:hypothetical protein DPMN_163781 [Dreissena polymorpha]|uniref:Uncharacterized protein n=1 Tax=Dreissena polymorpha TaxID=45954 RepID=A0A9D4EXF6_DREPO|nr:hypothetical protein DPMN_163781 [Dreissena polymorpha]
MMSAQETIALFILGCLLRSWTNAVSIQVPISAINVTTNGSQWYDWTADKVNQGDLRHRADECLCCTALHRPSWVQMGLNKPYIVERVLVLGRTDQRGQFDNINMSMGLWTESLQDEQFTFKNGTIAEMRLTPPREIQFVRVMGNGNSHFLVICEILLYRQADCPLGRYSVNCSKQCHYRMGSCDSVTGACVNGICEDGWIGMTCNETCHPGTFGANCSSICRCHNNMTCNHFNGSCPNNQCAAGWKHDNCSVACGQGNFGLNCTSPCHCLQGASCDHVSGNCPGDQCAPGWTTSNCSVACESGSYGQNCAMDCHCDKCHHINGSCAMSSQCHDGYKMDNGFCKPNEDTKQSLTIIWIVTTLGLCLLVVGVTIASLCIRRKKKEAKKKALQTAQQIEFQPSNRAQVLPDDTHDDNIVQYEVVPDAITKHGATPMYESLQMADTHLYSGLREAIPMSPAPFDVLGLIAESKTPVRRHFAVAEELDNATTFESKYTTAEDEENDNAAETNYADFELLENDSEEGKNYEAVNKEYQFVK